MIAPLDPAASRRNVGYHFMRRSAEDTHESSSTTILPGDGIGLTVIVPTRNESSNIAPLLDRLEAALAERAATILFVDDSTDQTPAVIRQESASRTVPISVIARPEGRRNGLSGAVVEGMEAARGRWVCVMDADLQHPPEIIPRLLDQANRTAADIVVASRQADYLGPVGLTRTRAITSQLLTILARMVFPRVLKNVSDPLTGFFLVRQAAIDTTTLQPEGFKILLEILARHPDLRVTELHFDFAPRHEGQSKADLNEGMRFFRHLTRLRLTVNQHLVRFLIVIMLAVIFNLSLLGGLVNSGWSVFGAATVAGGLTIAGVLIGEMWIFSDRPRGPARRRLAGVLLVSLIYLGVSYLPVIWMLAVQLGTPVLLAALVAMLVAGFVYYLFSEQWIWTRGLMMRPRASVYYNIHDLLTVASQIPLADLEYFRVADNPKDIDLQLRVDRHGTPSRVPNAICYDEHLGRFGFGLTVIPGDFTEIVVSPLLETSPSFLYTNVVEPVLQWCLVRRGYSLARAGSISLGDGMSAANDLPPAFLITGRPDLSDGIAQLCRDEKAGFMGDDRVIIGREKRIFCFPKPVTASLDLLPESPPKVRSTLALRLQRWLYSRPVRQLALFLSDRQLPVATVNTYLQRIIPQPKYPLDVLVSGITYTKSALPAAFITLDDGEGLRPLSPEEWSERLLEPGDRAYGFRPYPLLASGLSSWGSHDWHSEEKAILRAGLAGATSLQVGRTHEQWWEPVAIILRQQQSLNRTSKTFHPAQVAPVNAHQHPIS